MRIPLAKLLIRMACRLVQGHDDRVVILNTKRHRVRPGYPNAGAVNAFITSTESGLPVAFSPNYVPKDIGLPVPAAIARLAGFDVEPLG